MIGTIRKHSSWLWWIVAGLTIISFVWWGATPGTRNGGGRYAGYGTIYGKPVTREEFAAAQRDFYLYYWRRNGEFPNASVSRTDIDRGVYERIILKAKASQLGIHVGEDAQIAAANDFLAALGRDGQAVPMSAFVERILQPAGFTAADFQQFIADDLAIEQLVQTMGLSGALIPPQEAGQLFDREHQEVSAQAVFFSGTNYLSKVTATPGAVAQFFTNNMAYYRLPARVQVNYVAFELSNFMAAAEQKIGATNLTAQTETAYAQKGQELAPEAKTPAEAKATIRQLIIRQAAGALATEKARQFLTTLFAIATDPPLPQNFVALAQTNGLVAHLTAPFSEAEGPAEFTAPPKLVEDAFKLNPDSPFSTKPIPGSDAVYIIGLARQLPSEIPTLEEIRGRVIRDYQDHEAAILARTACTNFYFSAAVQVAAGKTFAQAALAAGQTPFALKPFSLSTTEVPEAEGHTDANEMKRAAFTTEPGHVSHIMLTAEGAFLMYVQSLLPVDEALKSSDLPQYLSQMRRQRELEAFNVWLNLEENHELPNTPVYNELTGHKTANR
jgi:hypothetical protein